MNPTRSRVAVLFASLAAVAVLTGGCPQPADDNAPLVARIGLSASVGPAPLPVAVSASSSTSTAGAITSVRWDFASQAIATTTEASHTFVAPGRYTITLTVKDDAGNEATTTAEVRVQGAAPTARITADVASGRAPLTVRFDGRSSSAPDDTILDYFWTFGDGSAARNPAPLHVYTRDGTFTVRLRVVTGGGVEASTESTITVGGAAPSVQFNGTQLATLPLTGAQTLMNFTVEAWFNADSDGGALLNVGQGALVISVTPASSQVRVQLAGANFDATASALAGQWRHVAVTVGAGGAGTIYLDGQALGTFTTSSSIAAAGLTVGNGFRGKAAEVRLWSVARSAAEVAAARSTRVNGAPANLLGAWPLNEGAGQSLANGLTGGAAGTLGPSASIEATDPAWSSDGPPLP